ncbi:hypothetical protein DPEC_G00078200 [Dallia pectoralis]|uniref:Uncharacterized protein n=1 Tax=Dallia pectoralis TaxID=75939 RepID=A0ACC2H4Z4_DALPE|nr:hypothetical protein DPEC_G00078200 [Dallia pectoralis]
MYSNATPLVHPDCSGPPRPTHAGRALKKGTEVLPSRSEGSDYTREHPPLIKSLFLNADRLRLLCPTPPHAKIVWNGQTPRDTGCQVITFLTAGTNV